MTDLERLERELVPTGTFGGKRPEPPPTTTAEQAAARRAELAAVDGGWTYNKPFRDRQRRRAKRHLQPVPHPQLDDAARSGAAEREAASA